MCHKEDKGVQSSLASLSEQTIALLSVFVDVGDDLLLEGVDDLGVRHACIQPVYLILVHRDETLLRRYVLVRLLL